MKNKLKNVEQIIEQQLKSQRELMVKFSELKDDEVVDKLRILGVGYSHCLMMIKSVLAD